MIFNKHIENNPENAIKIQYKKQFKHNIISLFELPLKFLDILRNVVQISLKFTCNGGKKMH